MLVDSKDKFLNRMAATVKSVRQKEGPLAGAVRLSKLNITLSDREKVKELIGLSKAS